VTPVGLDGCCAVCGTPAVFAHSEPAPAKAPEKKATHAERAPSKAPANTATRRKPGSRRAKPRSMTPADPLDLPVASALPQAASESARDEHAEQMELDRQTADGDSVPGATPEDLIELVETFQAAALATSPPEAEIRRWNWGAFFLTWVWGIGNHTYVALWALVPVLTPVMSFVLAAKGSEWAWNRRRWDSVDAFRRTQRAWAICGVAFCLSAVALAGVVIAAR